MIAQLKDPLACLNQKSNILLMSFGFILLSACSHQGKLPPAQIVIDNVERSEEMKVHTESDIAIDITYRQAVLSSGHYLTLDASNSEYPFDTAATFNWEIIAKPHFSKARLVPEAGPAPSINVDEPGTYAFALTLSIGETATKSETVSITVPVVGNRSVISSIAGE